MYQYINYIILVIINKNAIEIFSVLWSIKLWHSHGSLVFAPTSHVESIEDGRSTAPPVNHYLLDPLCHVNHHNHSRQHAPQLPDKVHDGE